MADYINKKLVQDIIPIRKQNSNKATFGKILNIAGSKKYSGAAALSSLSALKAGAGYVTLASVDDAVNLTLNISPEVVGLRLKQNNNGSIANENVIENIQNYDVISLGCGLTTDDSVKSFVYNLLPQISAKQNLVVDADGINIIAEKKGEITLKNAVITPHPRELSRLLKVNVFEINENREKYARICAQTYDCITVLKGNGTIVTNGEKVYINTTGNSALAKSGTGDVLTGIVAALLAQGLNPFEAAIASVYVHGLAGDIASSRLSEYCVLASDVISYLPIAYMKVLKVE